MNKKIGIVTFWFTKENFGQLLQLFALYNYLQQNGHDVFVLKYDATKDKSIERSFFKKIQRVLSNPSKLLHFVNSKIKHSKSSLNKRDLSLQGFDDFKQNRFNWSHEYNAYSELKSSPPEADIYICGSDMIWGEKASYKPYFLDFVKSAKKIAFSPSFGRKEISPEYAKEVKSMLSSFNAISVREESGVGICKQLGFQEAQWLPDPTTLLSMEEYIKIEQKPKQDNYIFNYILAHDTSIPFEKINALSEELNLDLVNCSTNKSDNRSKVYPSIEEWLGYVHHAKYIITNSFHGCMFAIIFKKEFIFLPLINNDARINERIYSFLNKMNLNDRIYKSNINVVKNKIDYDTVDESLNSWVTDAKNFLWKNI